MMPLLWVVEWGQVLQALMLMICFMLQDRNVVLKSLREVMYPQAITVIFMMWHQVLLRQKRIISISVLSELVLWFFWTRWKAWLRHWLFKEKCILLSVHRQPILLLITFVWFLVLVSSMHLIYIKEQDLFSVILWTPEKSSWHAANCDPSAQNLVRIYIYIIGVEKAIKMKMVNTVAR